MNYLYHLLTYFGIYAILALSLNLRGYVTLRLRGHLCRWFW